MNSGKGGRAPEGMETEMRIPARAVRPFVVLTLAAASLGCTVPPAYAENATAAVVSDDGGHVVDVDLDGSAPVGDETEQAAMKSGQGDSIIDAEAERAWKEFTDKLHAFEAYCIVLPTVVFTIIALLNWHIEDLRDRRRLESRRMD